MGWWMLRGFCCQTFNGIVPTFFWISALGLLQIFQVNETAVKELLDHSYPLLALIDKCIWKTVGQRVGEGYKFNWQQVHIDLFTALSR